ncbi:MAG: hypothetical protein WC494_02815 [Candidatus Pacearchaeota archaeon]
MNIDKEVSPEFYFHLHDGRTIKSLPELLDVLRTMSDEVYKHHVNSEKNDFIRWIADVCRIDLIRNFD